MGELILKLAEGDATVLLNKAIDSCVPEYSEVVVRSVVLLILLAVYFVIKRYESKKEKKQQNELKKSEPTQVMNKVEIQNVNINNNFVLPIIATGVVVAVLFLGYSRRRIKNDKEMDV